MKYSIALLNDGSFRISLTPDSTHENELFEKPISQNKQGVYRFFIDAIQDKFGVQSSILSVKDDSGLPNEIIASINIGGQDGI